MPLRHNFSGYVQKEQQFPANSCHMQKDRDWYDCEQGSPRYVPHLPQMRDIAITRMIQKSNAHENL